MHVASIRTPKAGGPYERTLRRILKKYPKAADDIQSEFDELPGKPVPDPPQRSYIPGLGKFDVLKVRVASTDMKVGKSGGFRVLILQHTDGEWSPLLAYAKSEREDVPRSEIIKAAKEETAA